MSKHDLKGIDTGKVGNNKNVSYTFKDYMKDYGLSEKGAIRDLEAKNVFLEDLNPVVTTQEKTDNFLRDHFPTVIPPILPGAPLGAVIPGVLPKPKQPDVSDLEVEDGRLVGKDRPKGIRGAIASLIDAGTYGLTDLDQKGGGPLQGLLTGSQKSRQGYGEKFTGDYELPKIIQEQAEAEKEEGSTDAVGDVERFFKAQMEYDKAMGLFNRKGRVADALLESALMRVNMPFVTNTMKDLSSFKQRQLLDAERVKQSLPNAIQARLLAADQGFASQAGAIAGQQDAATRFAGLGMQRRFG